MSSVSVTLPATFLVEAAPAFDDARGASRDASPDEYWIRLEPAVALIDAGCNAGRGALLIEIADPAIATVLSEEAAYRADELADDGRHSASRSCAALADRLPCDRHTTFCREPLDTWDGMSYGTLMNNATATHTFTTDATGRSRTFTFGADPHADMIDVATGKRPASRNISLVMAAWREADVEPTLVWKRSSELRAGDVVVHYTMRILLGDVIVMPAIDETSGNGYSFDGLVLNADDVDPLVVPRSWISEGRWTVQGNDRVQWRVEA